MRGERNVDGDGDGNREGIEGKEGEQGTRLRVIEGIRPSEGVEPEAKYYFQ